LTFMQELQIGGAEPNCGQIAITASACNADRLNS